ncbi:MAG TPA: O-antigen ligase family protein [Burkholderiales bacterium]|nr:O-antigen ligase family protein [Burkholderiales bacterium]
MTATVSRAATGRAFARASQLVWTDYWFLLATVVATIVTVDPLEMDLASDTVLKHLALAIATPAIILTLIGSGLRASWDEPERSTGPAALLWPLLGLAIMITVGGVYARFLLGIQNSFLTVGLYVFTAYFAAVMVCRSDNPVGLVRVHNRIILAGAFIMGLYLAAFYGSRQVYHEQIFLVIPMAALCFAARRGTFVRWGGGLFFLATAWLSQKYTAYLIGLLTAAWVAFFIIVPRAFPLRGLQRSTLVYWFWLMGGLAVLVFVFLGVNGIIELPTGNVSYRGFTYEQAWNKFLDSPLWGTLFSVEAVEKFDLYSIDDTNNMLATHSDFLDILANGGTIGFLLWAIGLWRVVRIAFSNLLQPAMLDRDWAPHAHALAVMSAAAVVTYVFNPILLQPSMAYLVWVNLGLLAGLALRVGPDGTGLRG